MNIARFIFTIWLALGLGAIVRGQTSLLWDPDVAAAGAQGGTGNWLTSSTPWLNGGTNQAWADGSNATFGGAAGIVTLNGPVTANQLTFSTTGYALQGTGTITLGGSKFVFVDTGISATVSLAFGGASGLTKGGAGTLTLNAAQTYTGTTDVGGTLILGPAGSLNSASSLSLFGTFDMTGHLQTIDALSGGGSIVLGNGTLTVGSNGASSTYGGVISGTGGLTKTGAGTFDLTNANGGSTYTGPTTIDAGVLQSSNGIPDMSTVVFANANASLKLITDGEVVGGVSGGGSNGAFVDLNGKTLTLGGNNADAVFVNGFTSSVGGGSLIKVGTGTQTVGVIFASTEVRVDAGTLRVGSGGLAAGFDLVMGNVPGAIFDANGTYFQPDLISGGGALGGEIQVGGGTVEFGGDNRSSEFAGTFSGTGDILKRGTGTFTLSGANTFTGRVYAEGTLKLGRMNALAAAGSLQMASGSTLEMNGFNLEVGSFSSDGITQLGSSTLTVGANGSIDSISSLLTTGPGLGRIVKKGSGELLFNSLTLFSGVVEIQSGIVRQQADALRFATVQLANTPGATLRIFTAAHPTVEAITGGGTFGGTVDIQQFGRLVVGEQGSSSTFDGFLTGTGGFEKSGLGVFTFNGTGNFGGPIKVGAGVLKIDGTIQAAGGTCDVFSGGTLSGNGDLLRIVQVAAGGTLAPGDPIDALTMSTLTLNSGSTLAIELSASGFDQAIVTDFVNINGTVNLSLSLLGGYDPIDFVDTFTIILNQGVNPIGGPGLFAVGGGPLSENDAFIVGSQSFRITYIGGSGNDVVLIAVPEPSSGIVIAGGLMALGTLRRRTPRLG